MTVPQSVTFRAIEHEEGNLSEERCPWCEQPVTHEKFEEIQTRISAKERERSAELESRMKEHVAQEKAQLEAKAKGEVEQAWKESAAAIEKAKLEAAAKEAGAREEALKTAEAAMAPKLAEAERAKKRAEDQAKDQCEALEKMKLEVAAKETLAREEARKAAEVAMRSELADAVQAKKAAEQLVNEQREALEKAKTEAVNAEKAKHFEEKLKIEEKLQQLQRQVQQKNAEELGEGAEVDLFETLKAEFPDDQITRVGKGAPGADILHRVMHNGKVCGCIVYDCKNRSQWRYEYATKLRQDQLSEKADHAILSTRVFPADRRQLHIQDGVIVANPARVIALVQILHTHVVQTHCLRLSNEARQQKTDCLYEFITSDRCTQLLDQIETLTDKMLELDVTETKAHQKTWKTRGELLRSVQRARGDFIAEIESIIESAATK